jgi:DNA topoisomerase-3
VGAHHAIIPTSRYMSAERLTQDERNIYELIARQYLMQFYPAFQYEEHQINTEVEGGVFIARQKSVVLEGWKELLPKSKSGRNDSDFSTVILPNVNTGDTVTCTDGKLDEKQTSPPKRFTDATLLAAMTGIARFVSNPEIKKVLKDTDGLGTEATRAGIIELLFKRQFLVKKGKEIHSTSIGRQLVTSLPEQMVVPDMTAHWESQLEDISQKRLKYGQFIEPLTSGLKQLIGEVDGADFQSLKGLGKKPVQRKRRKRKAPSGKKSIAN